MVDNTPCYAACLANLAFSSEEKFSYVLRVAFPLSIMVSTTGFISSLIASIHEGGMVHAKGQQNSIVFFHTFVNFKIFNKCHFPQLRLQGMRLMLNSVSCVQVNILR